MHFNPRSHERSDVFAFPAAVFAEISIHAPTRGATSQLRCTLSGSYFNPRSHERSDRRSTCLPSEGYLFQSTLPREERRSFYRQNILFCLFQSTLPREERLLHPKPLTSRLYFNPRSHERSDLKEEYYIRTKEDDFNPRSHERSDQCFVFAAVFLALISIHAPTRGATDRFLLLWA